MTQHTQTLPARLVHPTAKPVDFASWVQKAKEAVLRSVAKGFIGKVPFAYLDANGFCRHELEGHLICPMPTDSQEIPKGGTVRTTAAIVLLLWAEHLLEDVCQDYEVTALFDSIASDCLADLSDLRQSTKDHIDAIPHLSGDYKRMTRQAIQENQTQEKLARACVALARHLCKAFKSGHHPLDFLEQHLLSLYHMERQA